MSGDLLTDFPVNTLVAKHQAGGLDSVQACPRAAAPSAVASAFEHGAH